MKMTPRRGSFVALLLVAATGGVAVVAAPPTAPGVRPSGQGARATDWSPGQVPGAPLSRPTGGSTQVAPLNPRLGTGPRGAAMDGRPVERGPSRAQQVGGMVPQRPTGGTVSGGVGRSTSNVINQYKNPSVMGAPSRSR